MYFNCDISNSIISLFPYSFHIPSFNHTCSMVPYHQVYRFVSRHSLSSLISCSRVQTLILQTFSLVKTLIFQALFSESKILSFSPSPNFYLSGLVLRVQTFIFQALFSESKISSFRPCSPSPNFYISGLVLESKLSQVCGVRDDAQLDVLRHLRQRRGRSEGLQVNQHDRWIDR